MLTVLMLRCDSKVAPPLFFLNTMTLRLTLSIACALALLPSQAVRADQAEDEWLDLSLEELLNVEVSTASWNPTSLREAPASVTIFERRELERLGLRNLTEVLNFVPGAYSSRVAATGLENRTVLRGNPGTAGGGLLVIDGQRVNTMQAVRAWGVVRNFPVALIERVEIIRGPSSARFGGGPSDEVVNVVTRRDAGTLQAAVLAEGGHAVQSFIGQDAGPLRLDLRASQTNETRPTLDGLFDRLGRIDTSTEHDRTRTAIADLGLGTHGVQVFHHESDIDGYYGLNGSITPGDESKLSATWWRYQGLVEWAGWTINGNASELRQRYTQGGVAAAGGRAPFTADDFRQRGVLTHRSSSASLTLQRRFGPHTLTFGGDTQLGRTTQADLQSNYTLGPLFIPLGEFQSTGLRFVADGARDRMSAAYFEHDWRLTDTHRVVWGVRNDRSSLNGSASSPRLAWVWTPGERTTFKVLYQESFFAPSFSQRFLQSNPVIAGAPNLKPTRVEATELVARYQTQRLVFSASYYHRDAKDGYAVVPLNSITATTVNATRQHTEGLEASMQWTPSAYWRLRLTGSTVLADHYRLPARLLEAPPGKFVSKHTGSALLFWTPSARWDATLGAHWRSAEGFQHEANDPRALLQVNWRPQPELRLWLHVANAFNAAGYDVDVAGGLGIDPITRQTVRRLPLPGREMQLGVAWSWR